MVLATAPQAGASSALTPSALTSGTVNSGEAEQRCGLFAPVDGAANDRFGTSIGIDSEVMAVGAWLADAGEQRDTGAVYIHRLQPGDRWTNTQRLLASNPQAAAGFGFAVDLEGGILAVAAQSEAVDGAAEAGAVYVFEEQLDGSWTEVARLTAPNPAADDLFGHNLEVDEATATIVVGTPGADPQPAGGSAVENGGAAHVFVRGADGTWSHQAELIDPDAKENDRAGNDVGISGDWLVVGQHLNDAGPRGSIGNAGGALVFRRTGSTWDGPTEILGSDSQTRDRAGIGVDVDGDILVMTGWAQGPDDRAVAWVFRHDGESWQEQARIEPGRSTSPGSHFGRHVELSGRLLAIGASLDDGPGSLGTESSDVDRGAVHFYEESDGFWLERAKVTPGGADVGALAGISLALSDDWAAVGAERAALSAANSGGACVIRRADVLDGSNATDRRFGATVAVMVPPGSSVDPSSNPTVLIAAVAGGVVVIGAAAFVVSAARRRSGVGLR
ncbi:MAG: hypothetical protein ACRBK7_28735 [Acidimicrobiales bacterium]